MDRALEELVWERAGHRCEYCQVAQAFDRLPFEIDHVIAQKHGGPVLVGLSPIGRVTVAVLEINLDYRVAFRQGLIDEGVFPPTP